MNNPNRVMSNLLGPQWDSTSPEMRKQLLRQAAKRKPAAAAQDQLQAIKDHSSKRMCSGEKYGEVVLPPGVLQQVMACLAAIEPDGVRGPAMAAADLANAALVSWDFYTASKHGLAVLEQQAAALTLIPETGYFYIPRHLKCSGQTLGQLPYLPSAYGWSWAQWSALLQDPVQYRVPQLKEAASQLNIPITNATKAVLVVSILQAFGLQQSSRVHPQLLRAVVLERCCTFPWVGCDDIEEVWRMLLGCYPKEIMQKWPGLHHVLNQGWGTPAAERCAALRRYAGASSKQHLEQIKQEVQQWWDAS